MDNQDSNIQVETHPWQPFLPVNAKVLIMGTFPPGQHRWSMDFYYPNRTNDFWFMMGLIFFNNRDALYNRTTRLFNLPAIKQLLTDKGIALSDTGRKIRRLKGNASDKFLEILEPANLGSLLPLIPECHTIATTGEKAAGVIASLTDTPLPEIGVPVTSQSGLTIWRMPSTSRAYPLPLEKKAEQYSKLFHSVNIL